MGKREKSTQTPGQRKQRPLAWLHFETENDVLYFNCAGSCLDDQLEEILTSALASARKRLKAKRTPDPGFPNVSFGSFGTVSEEPSPKKPRSQSWD